MSYTLEVLQFLQSWEWRSRKWERLLLSNRGESIGGIWQNLSPRHEKSRLEKRISSSRGRGENFSRDRAATTRTRERAGKGAYEGKGERTTTFRKTTVFYCKEGAEIKRQSSRIPRTNGQDRKGGGQLNRHNHIRGRATKVSPRTDTCDVKKAQILHCTTCALLISGGLLSRKRRNKPQDRLVTSLQVAPVNRVSGHWIS